MLKTPYRNARSFTDSSKPKRTPHQRRPARTIVTRSQSHSRGDRFPRLPSEVFELILDKMSGKHATYRSKNSEIRWPFKQGWIQKCVFIKNNIFWTWNLLGITVLFRELMGQSCKCIWMQMYMFQCGTWASSAWCPRKLMDRSEPTSPPWPGGREWSMEIFIIPPASNRHAYLDIIKIWVSDTLAQCGYIHCCGHIATFTRAMGSACMNWRNLKEKKKIMY